MEEGEVETKSKGEDASVELNRDDVKLISTIESLEETVMRLMVWLKSIKREAFKSIKRKEQLALKNYAFGEELDDM